MNAAGRSNRLGRGLSALFGESESGAPAAARTPRDVPIETIRPGAYQPRRHFAETELDGLAQSIREKGIIQPLLVRPIDDADASFELIAGERRWRAAQRAGLHRVPVIVGEFSDRETLEIALVENLQRENLTAIEEAEAYNRLSRDFGRSQSAIAETVGKSRSHVANTVRLLGLPESVRQNLAEGTLSPGHARALLGAEDPAALAGEIIRRGLNVRMTERLVRQQAARPIPVARAPHNPDTAALERDLAQHLGLRVTLARNARGGTLSVHYTTLDQLDHVLALLRGR